MIRSLLAAALSIVLTERTVAAGTQFGVVINEIMYAPSLAAASPELRYEYVELFNRTAAPIALGSWQLRDLDAADVQEVLFTFPAIALPPGAFLTIYANAADVALTPDTDLSDGSGRLIAPSWTGAAILSNSGDAVAVYSAGGPTLEDFVYYDPNDIGNPLVDDEAVAQGLWINGQAIDVLSSATTGRALYVRVDGQCPNELINPDLDYAQYVITQGGTPGRTNATNVGVSDGDGARGPSLRISPMPVGDHARLELRLPEAAEVRLTVFDLQGRLVSVVARARQAAGTTVLDWRPSGLAPGLYHLRLEAAGVTLVRPVVVR